METSLHQTQCPFGTSVLQPIRLGLVESLHLTRSSTRRWHAGTFRHLDNTAASATSSRRLAACRTEVMRTLPAPWGSRAASPARTWPAALLAWKRASASRRGATSEEWGCGGVKFGVRERFWGRGEGSMHKNDRSYPVGLQAATIFSLRMVSTLGREAKRCTQGRPILSCRGDGLHKALMRGCVGCSILISKNVRQI